MITTKSHRLYRLLALSLLTALLLSGCSQEDKGLGSIASIGNGGSLDGQYNMSSIYVTDVYGGRASFGYGAVGGYPGASADIGGIGVPKRITGYWAKDNLDGPGFESYYRITADIDSELAEQKVRTLHNYYQYYQGKIGSMQVAVERERVRLFLSLYCPLSEDCSPKEGADPNNWVVDSPIKGLEVVELFDGLGESSPTPFPGSPYDERIIKVEPRHLSQKVQLTDEEGNMRKNGRPIGDLARIQGDWIIYEKTADPSVFVEHYFHLDAPIDTNTVKDNITLIRTGYAHKYFPTRTLVTIKDNGFVSVHYRIICRDINVCDDIEKKHSPERVKRTADSFLDILLFEAQAEESDTPFDSIDNAMDGKK